MKCVKCGGPAHVVDVRHDGDETYRKSICNVCGNETYSIEYPVEKDKQFERTWKSISRKKRK